MILKTLRYELADGIATITFDEQGSPVNTMCLQWQQDMDALAAQVLQDKVSIQGIILASAKSTFFAGADLKGVMRSQASDGPRVFAEIESIKKSFRTLETLGVPVVGYRTRELPGFFSMNTGLALTASLDTPDQIAAAWLAHRAVGGRSAMLVVQPPPAASALPAELVNDATDAALAAASAAGVRGAAVTPFLLADIQRRTAGQSVVANLALLESNAALAGRIAVALAAARVESAPT